MRIWALLLSLLSLGVLSAQERFSLDEISADFPSQDFAVEIDFWTDVFTQWGERDVLIHDSRRVDLIYRVMTFNKGVVKDPDESRRQRKILRRVRSDFSKRLAYIARYGPESTRLKPEHLNLVQVVRTKGVEPTKKVFRDLSRQVRYQRGIKEKFLEGLKRSGRYLDRMEEIFAENGLPRELAFLPHIESSFQHDVRSKAGALGMWQFMRGTGRRFLTINRYIDERLAPLKATEAAARYLAENYEILGTWPLAVTAYNHGSNGMKRAKRKHGSDFRAIVDSYRSRYFGFAGRNFYPEFLASIEISRNYREYFGAETTLEPPLQYEVVPLKRGYHVSHLTTIPNLSLEDLQAYNPQLTRHVWKRSRVVPSGYRLRVPPGRATDVTDALSRFKPSPSGVTIGADGSILYRVRAGDTLGRISRDFGVSTIRLQRLNGIRNPNRIRVGALLTVSRPGPEAATPERYRVRRGDNLSLIAKRFGTTVGKLKALNGLRNANHIRPGQVLVVTEN